MALSNLRRWSNLPPLGGRARSASRRPRKGAALSAVLLGLAVALAFSSAKAQGVAVALSPVDSVVAPDTQFDVRIDVVQAGHPFNTYEAVIEFDPTVLTFVQRPDAEQEGNYMKSQCGVTFNIFSYTSGSDSMKVTHSLLCANTSVTGPGVLYKLRFQASTQASSTEIRFRRVEFFNAGFDVQPVNTTNSSLIIGDPTDSPSPRRPTKNTIRVSPNPFNPVTSIRVETTVGGPQRVVVHDLLGRRVRLLQEGSFGEGQRVITWDGRDDRGVVLPSGAYLVTLIHPNGRTSRPIVLLK